MNPVAIHFHRQLLIFTFLLGITILICSCKKETIELEYVSIQSNITEPINAVTTDEDGNVWMGSGYRYEPGHIAKCDLSYTACDSPIAATNTGIQDIEFIGIDKGYAITTGNQFYHSTDGGLQWTLSQGYLYEGTWYPLYNQFMINENVGFAVGGEGHKKGVIFKTINGVDWVGKEWEIELRDIYFTSLSDGYMVGSGAALKTLDGGVNWSYMDIKGDFFRAIQFVTSNTGYIVGDMGSIYKTPDAGITWNKLRGQNKLTGSKYHFTDILFLNENTGYFCGENCILYTADGGETILEIDNLPQCNYRRMALTQANTIIAVGEDGCMVEIIL